MNVGQVIKFKQPLDDDEAKARFVLVEDNGDRGFARLICDMTIPPVSLVRMEDMEPAEDAGGTEANVR